MLRRIAPAITNYQLTPFFRPRFEERPELRPLPPFPFRLIFFPLLSADFEAVLAAVFAPLFFAADFPVPLFPVLFPVLLPVLFLLLSPRTVVFPPLRAATVVFLEEDLFSADISYLFLRPPEFFPPAAS